MPYLIDSDVLIAHREGQSAAHAALEYGYSLVTYNRRDFEDIPDLALYEPI